MRPKKRILKLRFTGAGVFYRATWSKDRAVDDRGKNERKHLPRWEVPYGKVDWRHLCNALHVLMGERPKPFLRQVAMAGYDLDPAIVDAARDARCEVDAVPRFPNGDIIPELVSCRKAIADSWQKSTARYLLMDPDGVIRPHDIKGGLLTWHRIHNELGNDGYGHFRKAVLDCGGTPDKITGREAIELLSSSYTNHASVLSFCDWCRANGCSSLYNIISPHGNRKSISVHSRTTNWQTRRNVLMVNSGPEYIYRMSGHLYVVLDGGLLSRLDNGAGVATFLEGGVIGIVDDYAYSPKVYAATGEPVGDYFPRTSSSQENPGRFAGE